MTRHLKADSPLRLLIDARGEEGAANLFIYAQEHWNKGATWPSVFDQRNQLSAQISGMAAKSDTWREPNAPAAVKCYLEGV